MPSMKNLLSRWPLLRQLSRGLRAADGDAAMSERTRALRPRTAGAQVARSVCPFCAVGCGQRIHHDGQKILAVDGDPASPINQGTLCPKGSASHQLLTHDRRLTRVRYRRPGGREWEELELGRAMDMIAERIWDSRARHWVEERDGEPVRHTTAVAHLGGATLDNEENYLLKKLLTAGLGIVCVSNQARI